MIDELLGKSYECAYESFCPDPCCHGVQSTSPLFLSRACSLNKCLNKNRCKIEPEFNDDFQAIRNNRWNITCPCGKGLMYRSDVETCVHADLCSESDKCPPSFDCVNTVTDPGYKCVCQLGFIRNDFDKCIPTGFSSAQWHGFAFTEPHPQLCIRNSIFISILMSFMLILPQ
ncbi:hypothetical protein DICVIV_01671 [Dictyocaulus viviparus]|uniref:EGF-like domain-containing protein n=1 Tax=Dictyocaulus viviparus TaxID=29172 RepID=A0A0D8Y7B0_DICVI|nr:hypothetical protein DICVIV_01671 [Dictyocaulus viviparus]